jgi:cytosine/adenosine deaminase-related metal-dependent hydrolase
MASETTQAIHGDWVLACENGELRIATDAYVLIEGERIAGISRSRPAACELVAEGEQHLVLPGLLNLHNHCLSAVPFRGLSEDMPLESSEAFPTELVYGLLMPMGDAAVRQLDAEENRAIMELGLLEVIKGGTTTLMEIFRQQQSDFFRLAPRAGLRFYGMPYLFSSSQVGVGADGRPTYAQRNDDSSMLDAWRRLHDEFDASAGGRVRVGLGPHGTDTCGPELLREVRRLADERGCLVTIHLSQTRAEVELALSRHGRSPAEYLDRVGLLGPDLLAAHCIFSSDDELALLARRGVSVANCPLTFARGGVYAPFHRFKDAGLRTVVATDGYCMDIVGEIRSAGFISKLHGASPGKTSAWELIDAVTREAADFLGRPDLGRIAPGATADLVVVDLGKPHFQPVSDPIKTFVWNASRADVHTVMVGGELVVDAGRYVRGDEREIMRRATAAVHRVWEGARRAGTVKPGYFEGWGRV